MNPRFEPRRGYVSLLATAFTFGLAALGTALTVGLGHYLNAAVTRERLIIDRITLESAAAFELGRLARGAEHPTTPFVRTYQLNDRSVEVDLSLPEGKHDLGMDEQDALIASLGERGLPEGLALSPPAGADGLARRARSVNLSARDEDRMRRAFTLGRAPEERDPSAQQDAEGVVRRVVAPGDQTDVRVGLKGPRGEQVLWLRARYVGDAAGAWRLHDYRRLNITQ